MPNQNEEFIYFRFPIYCGYAVARDSDGISYNGEAVNIDSLIQSAKNQGKREGLEMAREINAKERQATWKFFHECQLWEEQKSAVASLDRANEKIDQATNNLN